MLKALQQFVTEQKLFQSNQKILLAISGGIDSVVMAHLFNEAKFNFAIAHCNFSLREEESDGDEIFVRNLAKMLNVPFFTISFDTKEIASQRKISIQMAARELRYQWFTQISEENNYDYIATAHHANDVIETILLNFTRGTGIAGFHGISSKNGKVIRPMLFSSRSEIEKYAMVHGLRWREDSSNESDKYARNLIRHKVVPVLKEINPNLENTSIQTVARIGYVEKAFLNSLKSERKKFEQKHGSFVRISIRKVLDLPDGYLIKVLDDYGFSLEQTETIRQIISSDFQPGKQFISPHYMLVIDRNDLVLTSNLDLAMSTIAINDFDVEIVFERLKLVFEKIEKLNYSLINKPDIAELDYHLLQFPLVLRPWRKGDAFVPLGMKGRKKISDFLIDSKVPLNLKNQVKVLESGGEIVWVVGMRISNNFKVSDKTTLVLKIAVFNLYN